MSVKTLNVYECCSSNRTENVAIRLVKAPMTFIQQVHLWRQRVKSRRALSQLDDRLLDDIGMTRQQVEQEVEKPFWIK